MRISPSNLLFFGENILFKQYRDQWHVFLFTLFSENILLFFGENISFSITKSQSEIHRYNQWMEFNQYRGNDMPLLMEDSWFQVFEEETMSRIMDRDAYLIQNSKPWIFRFPVGDLRIIKIYGNYDNFYAGLYLSQEWYQYIYIYIYIMDSLGNWVYVRTCHTNNNVIFARQYSWLGWYPWDHVIIEWTHGGTSHGCCRVNCQSMWDTS